MSRWAPPRLLAPGTRLDCYELLCPLAEGGMAQVWVARLRTKQGLDTLFAVKVLSPRLADDPSARSMLIDEARIAARIRHPHVAQIVELGESDGHSYLVLEWVEGESLSLLRRTAAEIGRPFPVRTALTILAHACAGLNAAHELMDEDGSLLSVVHRDVSPQNILVGAAGDVKIIDFGIAKAARRLTQATKQGEIKGKLQYMAPEQVSGREVDRRADVWGVGAVLYHLLSGRPPYSHHDELSTLRLLLAREPPPPIEDVDTAVGRVLECALAPDPTDRFATAEELGRALEDAAGTYGGLLTARELGGYVDELVGPRLRQRRAALGNLLADRSPLPARGEVHSPAHGARERSTRTAPTELVAQDGPTHASSARTLPAMRRTQPETRGDRRWLWFGLAAGAGALGAGAAMTLRSSRAEPGAEAPSVPVQVEEAHAEAPPSATASDGTPGAAETAEVAVAEGAEAAGGRGAARDARRSKITPHARGGRTASPAAAHEAHRTPKAPPPSPPASESAKTSGILDQIKTRH